jgi:hypothetical protein
VAHFRFSPQHQNGRVIGFAFEDDNGFEATIDVGEMRVFVERLAGHLEQAEARPV